jgi:uncharacterized protein
MEIEKTLLLQAPPQQVWALILDTQAMASCVPGLRSVELIHADEYLALMQVKLAFINARFKLRTRITERDEPHRLVAEGTGEDSSVASSLKHRTVMQLTPHAAGGTELLMRVQVDVFGRIGSFGLSAMKTKADRLWDEFGEAFAARLAVTAVLPVAAPAAAPEMALGVVPIAMPEALPNGEPVTLHEPLSVLVTMPDSVPVPVPSIAPLQVPAP